MKRIIISAIYRIFNINDWVPVWEDSAKYKVYTSRTDDVYYDVYVFYTIWWSKGRNRYKLVCSGGDEICDPKSHQYYSIAMKKLVELSNTEYIQDGNIDYINKLNNNE